MEPLLKQKIMDWGLSYLLAHDYTPQSNIPEVVQDTPWSFVLRFLTSKGSIYLKNMPPLIALEPIITQVLHHRFQAPVPEVIAHDATLHCFLMKDAGSNLRAELKKQFEAHLLCQTIDQFTNLQTVIADHVHIFLELGVPDWRLDQLPKLYQALLADKALLVADGLSEGEIKALEALLPTISELCEKLSRYAIPQTMVQPDFHDNNVLIDPASQKLTFIDWGEIAISHPFFSLINCLYHIKKHHGLTDQDPRYLMIQEACFKNYEPFESKKHIVEAWEIARILFFMYSALCHHRLILACDKERLISSFSRHGRVSMPLKELLRTERQ